MKKKVPALGSVFRLRRNNNKEDVVVAAGDANLERHPVIDRVSGTNHSSRRPEPSLKLIDVARERSNGASATVSTLTNDRQTEVTMKMSEALIREATGDTSARTIYREVEPEAVGIDHLSIREQMWYKNQMYLLAKQKGEFPSPRTRRPATRISTRYESNDRYVDQSTVTINHENRNSPMGVAEFEDQFQSTNMYKNTRTDSRKEVRFQSKIDHVQSNQEISRAIDDYDDDNLTKQSSSIFSQEDASTSFDDDTRTTYQSSSLLQDEDTITVADETLGSIETILEESTLDDGQSYLTSHTEGTTSYNFQMADDGNHRRKYQLGMGQNPRTTSKSRRGTATENRQVTAIAPRGRRGKNAKDDSDFVDDGEELTCPCLPAIMEEVSGTADDAKSALNQVLHAFFISGDDIDRMADKLRDAKLELIDMHHDQVRNGGSQRVCIGSPSRGALL